MFRAILPVTLVLAASGVAVADEVWTGQDGERVTYHSDVGSTAILQSSTGEWFYIENLAGNNASRQGTFSGIWMIPDGSGNSGQSECWSSYTGVDGQTSNQWADISIRFFSPSFPSGFELARTYCRGPMDSQGRPLDRTTEFFNFMPVTTATSDEGDVDLGYNDDRPGMNQQYECLDRMRVHLRLDGFNMWREQNHTGDGWLIHGYVVFPNGYRRRFDCEYSGGQVVRVNFHFGGDRQ